MRFIRIFLIFILAGPGLILLILGPRDTVVLPEDRVIVDYWEKWTGKEESQMRSIVDDFNNTIGKQKGIFVRYLSTSSVNQKTLIATAAGVPPDIAGLWDPNVPQFAAMDALEPLDDLAKTHGIIHETYKPVFWKSCHYDGKLYALVSTPYNVALHYNTRIFAQNASALRAGGLDPDRAPSTIAELDAYAKILDKRSPDGAIDVAGYLPLEPGWYASHLPFWFGGAWWDDKNKRFTFTDPKVIKAFEWIQSYYQRLGYQAMSEFRAGTGNFDSPQNPFMAETLAMVQHGTFLANYIRNAKPSMVGHWAAAPFPSADPDLTDVTYCTSDVLVIPRGAKHPREAFEFIAYVNRQDVMERLCNMHCKITPLAKVSDQFMNEHSNPYIRVFERLAASPNAHGTPPVPILPQVGEELGNLFQKIAAQQTTPAEALPAMQERLQKKYDEFIARQNNRRSILTP